MIIIIIIITIIMDYRSVITRLHAVHDVVMKWNIKPHDTSIPVILSVCLFAHFWSPFLSQRPTVVIDVKKIHYKILGKKMKNVFLSAAVFDQYIALSRKRYKKSHKAYLLWNTNRTRMQSIERCHSRRTWGSQKLDFKVKIFFNVKYLENGTRQSYSYHGRLTVHDLWNGAIFSDLEWLLINTDLKGTSLVNV